MEAELIHAAQIAAALSVVGAFVFSVCKWVWPVLHRIGSLPGKIDKIYYEITPNNGKSIKDTLDYLSKEVTAVAARQWGLVSTQGDPVWESNAYGECLRANTAMLSLLERSMEQMEKNEWENIVHTDDAEWVLPEWTRAINQGRAFEAVFRIEAAMSKRVFRVTCIASSYKANNGTVLGYIGRYTKVEEIV